jgi:polyhydroxybutyrate depolymerase
MIKDFFIFLFFAFLFSGCLQEGQFQDSLRSGLHAEFIFHDGMKRTYTLYVPSSYDNNKSYPLLILLHGGGGTGEGMIKLTRGGFNALAEKEGFIIAYPDGIENHWNDGRNLRQYRSQRENIDDVGFISDLIDTLDKALNIDSTRVYAVGISNGGMMAQRLACELTDRIAAIGVIASAMTENLHSFCKPSRPIPVLLISGTEDPLVPFEGGEVGLFGKNYGAVLSVAETKEFWVKNNGCFPHPQATYEPDVDPTDSTRVRKEVYRECSEDGEVVLYVIEGGGHTWPSGQQYLPEKIIGRTCRDIDANTVLWDFFKNHTSKKDEKSTVVTQPGQTSPQKSNIASFKILANPGGRVSWLHSENIIAFDRVGNDSYFDVYIMNPDGSDSRCLTCEKSTVPQLHDGNPSWQPSGEYIVFQAQDPGLETLRGGNPGDYFASPGIGINNNLWITNANGTKFWQVTHVKERYGTLHPQFSPDGKKLLWSEVLSPQGSTYYWVMKLADFSVVNGEPRISNVQTLQPLDLMLYETHGFSPDGTKILFSGIEEGKYYYDMEIYTMDLTLGIATRLTDNDEWDEHAHFTPDGTHIVWTSSEGTPQKKSTSWGEMRENPLLLEYWVMNPDGSGKRKLSGFNDPASPDYMNWKGGVGLGDFDFSPDGKSIVVKMRKGFGGEIVALISFAPFPQSHFIEVE